MGLVQYLYTVTGITRAITVETWTGLGCFDAQARSTTIRMVFYPHSVSKVIIVWRKDT